MSNRIYPKQGATYTYRQMCEVLALRDSPSLEFTVNGVAQYLQTSHCTQEQMLAVPHMADTLWVYQRETDEWIPCFRFSEENAQFVDDLFDMVPLIDPYADGPGHLWVTPKGHPREQYHKLVPAQNGEEAYIIGYDEDERYPLPVFDEHGHSEHYYIRKNNPGFCDKCKVQAEKRFNYRDPTEGNCRLYELCQRCLQRNRECDRKEFADD